MLLASSTTFLFTAGLALYDYIQKRKSTKEKKRNYQSIKILLTGGPYFFYKLDVEVKVKELTVFINPSKLSLVLCS